MTAYIVISIFVFALVLSVVMGELRRDLTMMQQNSYRVERYRRWLSESADTTSAMRLLGLMVFFICIIGATKGFAVEYLAGIFALYAGWTEMKRKYKKPLVMTARAKRIFGVSVVLTILISTIVVSLFCEAEMWLVGTIAMLGCYCASHLITIASVWILSPVERHINRRYYLEASRMLADMPDLKIIGITGSYGKTSTKYFLYDILSEHFDTLLTPGSFNTTLGVVRTVREQLKPYHQVFIVEMGAKQPHDIAEICDLVHPHAGIVTAVGPMHLETFGSIENVQRTKFELVDALPSDGLAVINNDFEYIANRKVDNCRCIRYSAKPDTAADVHATDIEYSNTGSDFVVTDGTHEPLRLHTRLLGEANISDITAAVVIARSMGVPDEKIRRAVERIAPVEHRLSMTRTAGGITILDDAYNSNPVGSAMALEVLRLMKGGRRIIVTPGMIELGEKQFELNRDFGEGIARSADIAIIVGRYNRDAITEGIRKKGFPEGSLHTVDTFDEARRMLSTMLAAGDTVLYENDLPDTFK